MRSAFAQHGSFEKFSVKISVENLVAHIRSVKSPIANKNKKNVTNRTEIDCLTKD